MSTSFAEEVVIMFAGLLRTKIINSDVDEVPLSYVIKNW